MAVVGNRQNPCRGDASYSQAAYAVPMYKVRQTMTETVMQSLKNTRLQSDDGAGDDSFDERDGGTTAIADAVKPRLKNPLCIRFFC